MKTETADSSLLVDAKSRKATSRRFCLAATTLVLALIVSFALAEISLRLFAPTYIWKFRNATEDWEIDGRLGWKQKGNLDVTTREMVENGGWIVRFRTNPDGLTPHTATREKHREVIRIMIFGDSTVVGRAVPHHQTVNAQLKTIFKEAGKSVEVINAGVQGYSTDQVYLRMTELMPLYRPDIVMYGLCSNDFGGNVSPEAYGLAKPMLKIEHNGTLKEIPTTITSSGKVPAFGSGPASWIQYSAVYRSVLPITVKLRASMMNWEQRNLLGLAPAIYYDKNAREQVDWRLFGALLKAMDNAAIENGAKFYLYAHPAAEEVWLPYIKVQIESLGSRAADYDQFALQKELQHISNAASVNFIPMIEYFLANQNRGPFHLLPRDPHANPAGYRLQAEVIANRLLQ